MGTLYENIKRLCDERGISPYTVARELGYSKNTISVLKSGKGKSMTAPKLQAFADYFGITVDELLNPDIKKDPAEDEVDLQEEIAKLKKRTEGSSVFFNGKELDLETIAAINASLDVIEKMLEAK